VWNINTLGIKKLVSVVPGGKGHLELVREKYYEINSLPDLGGEQ